MRDLYQFTFTREEVIVLSQMSVLGAAVLSGCVVSPLNDAVTRAIQECVGELNARPDAWAIYKGLMRKLVNEKMAQALGGTVSEH